MILIGSSAIKHWFPDFKRQPKDIDNAVISKEGTLSMRGVEYLENPVLFKYYSHEPVLPPDGLYTLKMSHLFWNINWEKHMFDVQFLKSKWCRLNKPMFFDLYEYWQTVHGKNKRSDLQMSAKDFFDNALKNEYEHDDLHTIINPIPTYTKILKDGAEVEVCENKFNLLTHNEKCDLVREEVMIMAWERHFSSDYRIAYSIMLKKFIMSHAPIWEAIFIIENYIELIKPTFNYFKTIENGLHTIKRTA